jgi:hypothetical protein
MVPMSYAFQIVDNFSDEELLDAQPIVGWTLPTKFDKPDVKPEYATSFFPLQFQSGSVLVNNGPSAVITVDLPPDHNPSILVPSATMVFGATDGNFTALPAPPYDTLLAGGVPTMRVQNARGLERFWFYLTGIQFWYEMRTLA